MACSKRGTEPATSPHSKSAMPRFAAAERSLGSRLVACVSSNSASSQFSSLKYVSPSSLCACALAGSSVTARLKAVSASWQLSQLAVGLTQVDLHGGAVGGAVGVFRHAADGVLKGGLRARVIARLIKNHALGVGNVGVAP